MSQTEKEKEHLTDGMNALKLTNNSLIEQLRGTHKTAETRNNEEALQRKKEPCRKSTDCHYWKQGRCHFDHAKDENKGKADLKKVQGENEENTGKQQEEQTNTRKEFTIEDGNEADSKEKEITQNTISKMCPDGKACKQRDRCTNLHDCNYRACRHGDSCKYIHEENINNKFTGRNLCKRAEKPILRRNAVLHLAFY